MNMDALSELIAEARSLYKETSRPNVVVYTADTVCPLSLPSLSSLLKSCLCTKADLWTWIHVEQR
jgi:hypothetical protein